MLVRCAAVRLRCRLRAAPAVTQPCTGVVSAPAQRSSTAADAAARAPPAACAPQVVPQLGLCVTLYEILDVQGGAVYAGEGAALYTVRFSMARAQPRARAWPPRVSAPLSLARCTARSRAPPPQVFFCPFVGEVLTGRIKSADQTGLRVRAQRSTQPPRPLVLTQRRSVAPSAPRCRSASSTTCTCRSTACKSRPSCARPRAGALPPAFGTACCCTPALLPTSCAPAACALLMPALTRPLVLRCHASAVLVCAFVRDAQ
jgi:hypothetical protein